MQETVVWCQLVPNARIWDVKRSACLYLCVCMCRSFAICTYVHRTGVCRTCKWAIRLRVPLWCSYLPWWVGLLCACSYRTCLHFTHSISCLYLSSYRYWSCCLKRTSDFDEFLRQEGCTKGEHRWTGPVVSIAQLVCIWVCISEWKCWVGIVQGCIEWYGVYKLVFSYWVAWDK